MRPGGAGGESGTLSVSLPLFYPVSGAQLVFLTSPQVPREGRVSYEYPGQEQCVWEGECGRDRTRMPPAVGRGWVTREKGTERRIPRGGTGHRSIPSLGRSV